MCRACQRGDEITEKLFTTLIRNVFLKYFIIKSHVECMHIIPVKRRAPAPRPRIGRAVICNGESAVYNMGNSPRHYCQ